MAIVRNRWVFGRPLVSTLAFAVSIGLMAPSETATTSDDVDCSFLNKA